MPNFVEYCSKFLNICAILRIAYLFIEEYNRPIRRDYMSVIKRLFSFFLLVLTLLLLQHVISCRIEDSYNEKITSQNYAYQHLHLRSVAKTVVKKSTPAQDYLSAIFLASMLIAHLKFDIANVFFTITHVPVYLWQLARCDLSKTPVYRTKDEI